MVRSTLSPGLEDHFCSDEKFFHHGHPSHHTTSDGFSWLSVSQHSGVESEATRRSRGEGRHPRGVKIIVYYNLTKCLSTISIEILSPFVFIRRRNLVLNVSATLTINSDRYSLILGDH